MRSPNTTKYGLRMSGLLYLTGISFASASRQSSSALPWLSHRPACSTTPPASRTTMSAAAVSHSHVGARRGYMWALPSATISSLIEEPTCLSSGPLNMSTNSLVSADEWLLLPTILSPGWSNLNCATLRRTSFAPLFLNQAPCPLTAQYVFDVQGTCTTPSTGPSFPISAMLTVNSPFRLRNSFVPSKGSTSQKYWKLLRTSCGSSGVSSETTGMCGVKRMSSLQMIELAAKSAFVSGDASDLSSTPQLAESEV
mmetsp:Transcript_11122/g.19411  ORF Transcript_11122/g.19411 Transcript_11122/m.19411 type:complete len:254 (-) Transcript_11122:210-971(-)